MRFKTEPNIALFTANVDGQEKSNTSITMLALRNLKGFGMLTPSGGTVQNSHENSYLSQIHGIQIYKMSTQSCNIRTK